MEPLSVVERDGYMNGIYYTWSFKIKNIPYGLIKKFKFRFCSCSYHQLEVVYFFEKYVPVMQFTTIWFMLILEVLLGIKSKQGDVTAAFINADVYKGENI